MLSSTSLSCALDDIQAGDSSARLPVFSLKFQPLGVEYTACHLHARYTELQIDRESFQTMVWLLPPTGFLYVLPFYWLDFAGKKRNTWPRRFLFLPRLTVSGIGWFSPSLVVSVHSVLPNNLLRVNGRITVMRNLLLSDQVQYRFWDSNYTSEPPVIRAKL